MLSMARFRARCSRASRANFLVLYAYIEENWKNLGEFGVYRGKLANLGDFLVFTPFTE